jgi:hypothetical protein
MPSDGSLATCEYSFGRNAATAEVDHATTSADHVV